MSDSESFRKACLERKRNVGVRLSYLRQKRGLRQNEVARIVGVSPQALSHYEHGRSEPAMWTLVRLADLYGVPLDFLIRGGDLNA